MGKAIDINIVIARPVHFCEFHGVHAKTPIQKIKAGFAFALTESRFDYVWTIGYRRFFPDARHDPAYGKRKDSEQRKGDCQL